MFLNYKLQATNYKQTTNHKLQITNKEVSFGQILNAFGEEHKLVAFIKPAWAVCNFGHCNLGFVCNLYFVICNFFSFADKFRTILYYQPREQNL
jgi:hypothetical protein